MPNYSREEFLVKLQGAVGDTNAPVADPSAVGPPVAPEQTQSFESRLSAAMGQAPQASSQVNSMPRSVSAVSNLSFQQQQGRRTTSGEMIPIDVTSGMPEGKAIWQRAPQDKLAVIRQMYPDGNARLLDNGEVTVEVVDSKTGKPKDVMVNPAGMDAHDLLDLAVQAPSIAAGIAIAAATGGAGFWRTAGQIIASSLGASTVGGIQDAASRKLSGLPVRPGEIAQYRGGEATLDMFFQGALGTGAKALRGLSPFARDIKPGSMEFDLESGSRFLKDTFDVDIKRTPAEITGSPALGAIEAIESPQPGARNVLGRLRQKREEDLRYVQKVATGAVPAEDEVGKEAIETIRDKVVLPIENAITSAREAAEAKGQRKLVSEIDRAIGMRQGVEPITPTMAGVKTLEEFESKLAQAEGVVNAAYAKVNELPGGKGNVLSGNFAAAAAADIRKELPAVEKTVQKNTGLTDASGNPITREAQETQALPSGVPEGLDKALKDLENLKGGKVSLQTLTNMKRSAWDAIAAFKTAHGDVKDRWFTKIATAYDKGLDEAIAATGDPSLKNALTNAKETFKKEILPFERPGVKEMAKGEFDAARLSPEQIATRLFEGPKAIENFRMLKETLGANNPAFRVLKRSWLDSQIFNDEITDRLTGTVNAQKLLDKFTELKSQKKEIADEVFGNNFTQIYTALRSQAGLQKVGTLDVNEVKTLLSLKNPTRDDLLAILKMNKNRSEVYVNEIIRDVADGVEIASKIKPSEFLSRLSNTKTPPGDVDKILQVLERESPETRKAISTLTFYKILNESSISEGSTAVRSLAGEPVNLSAKKIAEALGKKGSEERARNDLLLGGVIRPTGAAPPKIGATQAHPADVLESLAKIVAPREAGKDAFGSAGGLAQGTAVMQAVRNPLKYAGSFAKNFFIALAYTTDTGTKMISNRVFGPAETAVIANTLIASEPFVRRATETLGAGPAAEVIGSLKDSIDQFISSMQADTTENRKRQEIEKVKRGQPANVKMTTP